MVEIKRKRDVALDEGKASSSWVEWNGKTISALNLQPAQGAVRGGRDTRGLTEGNEKWERKGTTDPDPRYPPEQQTGNVLGQTDTGKISPRVATKTREVVKLDTCSCRFLCFGSICLGQKSRTDVDQEITNSGSVVLQTRKASVEGELFLFFLNKAPCAVVYTRVIPPSFQHFQL